MFVGMIGILNECFFKVIVVLYLEWLFMIYLLGINWIFL